MPRPERFSCGPNCPKWHHRQLRKLTTALRAAVDMIEMANEMSEPPDADPDNVGQWLAVLEDLNGCEWAIRIAMSSLDSCVHQCCRSDQEAREWQQAQDRERRRRSNTIGREPSVCDHPHALTV